MAAGQRADFAVEVGVQPQNKGPANVGGYVAEPEERACDRLHLTPLPFIKSNYNYKYHGGVCEAPWSSSAARAQPCAHSALGIEQPAPLTNQSRSTGHVV